MKDALLVRESKKTLTGAVQKSEVRLEIDPEKYSKGTNKKLGAVVAPSPEKGAAGTTQGSGASVNTGTSSISVNGAKPVQ
jgi:hypothetical protein